MLKPFPQNYPECGSIVIGPSDVTTRLRRPVFRCPFCGWVWEQLTPEQPIVSPPPPGCSYNSPNDLDCQKESADIRAQSLCPECQFYTPPPATPDAQALADDILDAECSVESAAAGLDLAVTYLADVGQAVTKTNCHLHAAEIERKRCLDILIEAVKTLDRLQHPEDRHTGFPAQL